MEKVDHATAEAWKFFLVGRIAQEQEQYLVALDAFEKALAHDPSLGYAQVTKGCVLARLDRVSEAINAFDQVVNLFSSSPDPLLRERAAIALNNKVFALSSRGRHDEAFAANEEIIARFWQDTNALVQRRVALAINNRARALAEENKNSGTDFMSNRIEAAYRQLADKYSGEHDDPAKWIAALEELLHEVESAQSPLLAG